MTGSTSTDVLPPAELCVVGGPATTAREALQALSGLALEHGYVREGHAEALLAREEAHPTGLPMPMPLAIPHTDASFVRRPTLAAYVPQQPVSFGEMGSSDRTVEARLVLMLAVADPAAQVPLLGRLIRALQGPDLEQRLLVGLSGPAELAERWRDVLGA